MNVPAGEGGQCGTDSFNYFDAERLFQLCELAQIFYLAHTFAPLATCIILIFSLWNCSNWFAAGKKNNEYVVRGVCFGGTNPVHFTAESGNDFIVSGKLVSNNFWSVFCFCSVVVLLLRVPYGHSRSYTIECSLWAKWSRRIFDGMTAQKNANKSFGRRSSVSHNRNVTG